MRHAAGGTRKLFGGYTLASSGLDCSLSVAKQQSIIDNAQRDINLYGLMTRLEVESAINDLLAKEDLITRQDLARKLKAINYVEQLALKFNLENLLADVKAHNHGQRVHHLC